MQLGSSAAVAQASAAAPIKLLAQELPYAAGVAEKKQNKKKQNKKTKKKKTNKFSAHRFLKMF